MKKTIISIGIYCCWSLSVAQNSIDSLKKALDRETSIQKQIELNISICEKYTGVSFNDGNQFCQQAIELSRKMNDPDLLVVSLLTYSSFLSSSGKNSLVEEYAREAMSLKPKKSRLPRMYNMIGTYHLSDGQSDSALYYYNLYRVESYSQNQKEHMANSDKQLGLYYAIQSNYSLADSFWNEALKSFDLLANKEKQTSLLLNLALLGMRTSNYYKANAYAIRGLHLSKEINNVYSTIGLLNILLKSSVHQGDTLQGIEYGKEAIELIASEQIVSAQAGDVLIEVSGLYSLSGSASEARSTAEKCVQLGREGRLQYQESMGLAILAELDEAEHRSDKAFTNISQALDLVPNMYDQQLANDIREIAARVYLKQNRLSLAKKCIDEFHQYSKGVESPGAAMVWNNLQYLYYQKTNEFDKAITHLERFKEISDKIQRSSTAKDLIAIRAQYEADQKDLEIEKQQAKIELINERNKNRITLFFVSLLSLVSIFGGIYLHRSRKFAKIQMNQQQAFTKELIDDRENERKRLSRELHDGIAQELSIIKGHLASKDDLQSEQLVANSIDELRNVARALHPAVLERLGLEKGVAKLVDGLDYTNDAFFEVDIEDLGSTFNKKQELHVYRIVQEALNNALKHSKSTAIKVKITKTIGGAEIVVQDFGKGFNTQLTNNVLQGIGMKTMQERSEMIPAKLLIQSKKEQGTMVKLTYNKRNGQKS